MRSRSRSISLVAAAAALAGIRCGGDTDASGAKTVVLVTVDTLRRDFVSAYTVKGTAPRATTPRMDSLAGAGLRFLDARSPVPLTLPAHVTMLCGLPPAAHGVRSNSASRVPPKSARKWPLLAESLSDAGICCGAFVSAGPLVERYGLSAGFHAYDDGALGGRGRVDYARRPGKETVDRALAWLAGVPADRSAFLWVHLFEPHEPYRGDYRTSVEEADAVVGLLLDGLAAGKRRDAAILLASDHGEALGELGEPTHAFLLGESVLRVPLLLRAPGVAPSLRADPADLADVAPTLARLFGVSFPRPEAPVGAGIDLLRAAAQSDRPRVAESLHAWHQHRWAQLSCAVVSGVKVEDRGKADERPLRLFRLHDDAPPWQDGGTPAEGRPDAVPAVDALRAYRRAEDRRSDPGGAAPGGYGGGGPVGAFADPDENGRHADPYEMISDTVRLGEAALAITAAPPLPARLDRAKIVLDALFARDPDNPAVAFWRGRLERTHGRHGTALAAFGRALELGWWDADTLLLAGRSALAANDPQRTLDLLAKWRERIPADARLLDLEAEAYGRLGDGANAAVARERAKALDNPDRSAQSPGMAGCR